MACSSLSIVERRALTSVIVLPFSLSSILFYCLFFVLANFFDFSTCFKKVCFCFVCSCSIFWMVGSFSRWYWNGKWGILSDISCLRDIEMLNPSKMSPELFLSM